MFPHRQLRILACALIAALALAATARADEELPVVPQAALPAAPEVPLPVAQDAPSLIERASSSIQTTLDKALDLLGVRYRWGGTRPETGFDCSGFVRHVFHEGLGLDLPRSARAQSQSGEPIAREDLKPGDLVFFNTRRRRAFSHVGIYLGDDLFVHAPHRGASVRVEDLSARYWLKHFNGARRVTGEQ
ncbi:MAG TPA: C40 family peptidase [Rhodocyclaceae bacterium]|nr:C40 family peptidase [Rhodocyclaceae bacterium]